MNCIMNEIYIEGVIEKLHTYRRLESQNFDEIIKCLKLINDNYKTNNTNSLNTINNNIKKKFVTRDDCTQTNIFIYSKNLETYRKNKKKTGDIFQTKIDKL